MIKPGAHQWQDIPGYDITPGATFYGLPPSNPTKYCPICGSYNTLVARAQPCVPFRR